MTILCCGGGEWRDSHSDSELEWFSFCSRKRLLVIVSVVVHTCDTRCSLQPFFYFVIFLLTAVRVRKEVESVSVWRMACAYWSWTNYKIETVESLQDKIHFCYSSSPHIRQMDIFRIICAMGMIGGGRLHCPIVFVLTQFFFAEFLFFYFVIQNWNHCLSNSYLLCSFACFLGPTIAHWRRHEARPYIWWVI